MRGLGIWGGSEQVTSWIGLGIWRPGGGEVGEASRRPGGGDGGSGVGRGLGPRGVGVAGRWAAAPRRSRWALGGGGVGRVGDSGSSPAGGRLSGSLDGRRHEVDEWLGCWAGLRPRRSKKYTLQKFPTPRAVARLACVPAPPLDFPQKEHYLRGILHI
jgi:hypothetical protein